MSLTMIVPTTKRVPVVVIAFRWCGALTIHDVDYKCSACRKSIGTKRFGIAMLANRSLRLCEACGLIAEQDLAAKGLSDFIERNGREEI